MSTRETLESVDQGNIPLSGENASDDNVGMPNCTIGDIDRAVFDLFDKQLPLFYNIKKEVKRVPIVFAGGERFAIIARKKPLRDRNNTLILPVISIMRSSLTADNEMGMASNQAVPQITKKKLSRKDPRYQRIVNKLGLKNSDDLPDSSAFLEQDKTQPLTGATPGRIASRRAGSNVPMGVRRGNLLTQPLENNIFEVLQMPPVQFVTVTYEVMIWTQYIQQMNNITMAIMSNMQNYVGRSFRLEARNGYTFVAYLDPGFEPNNNFDEFTDSERIIRTSFTMKVPGYLIGETYPGAPSRARAFVSSPQITFEMNFVEGDVVIDPKNAGIPSANPDDYILDNRLLTAPLPGQSIGGVRSTSNTDPSQPGISNIGQEDTALIGGTTNDIVASPVNYASGSAERGGSGTAPRISTLSSEVNPFTGKNEDVRSYLKTRTSRNGETVYREII
jgi:hypothetical protein